MGLAGHSKPLTEAPLSGKETNPITNCSQSPLRWSLRGKCPLTQDQLGRDSRGPTAERTSDPCCRSEFASMWFSVHCRLQITLTGSAVLSISAHFLSVSLSRSASPTHNAFLSLYQFRVFIFSLPPLDSGFLLCLSSLFLSVPP